MSKCRRHPIAIMEGVPFFLLTPDPNPYGLCFSKLSKTPLVTLSGCWWINLIFSFGHLIFFFFFWGTGHWYLPNHFTTDVWNVKVSCKHRTLREETNKISSIFFSIYSKLLKMKEKFLAYVIHKFNNRN